MKGLLGTEPMGEVWLFGIWYCSRGASVVAPPLSREPESFTGVPAFTFGEPRLRLLSRVAPQPVLGA
ncbi:MAG: hypothetical protein M5U19_05310 [Microthrixaceae bacterium]|nr:hypothetical protein [Microthrixaceae bacterium]